MSQANNPCEDCTQECRNSEHGCKVWRNWFLKTWNSNICRRPPEQKTREVFTYEHPDRVREMNAQEKSDG